MSAMFTVSGDDISVLSERLGLGLLPGEVPGVVRAVRASLSSYDRVLAMSGDSVRIPPEAGRFPLGEDNPFGAWLWQGDRHPTGVGVLDGRSVVMKDNISMAGAPMTVGSHLLADYVASTDATVVTRVLAAGGTITGRAVCEDLCFSGNSFTSSTGPVRNPHDPLRSSGGSSSGCAVLVATGEADMAIGADQGGSVRGPAAWSGIVGLKPTYGLIPYTGIFPVEMTVDHAGPMAYDVIDVARLLDAVSGMDELDPRQREGQRPTTITAALDGEVSGLRIGVVGEGFGWPGLSDQSVDQAVLEAARSLGSLGLDVRHTSIPLHRDAVHIFAPIMAEGSTALMFEGSTGGTNWTGRYDVDLLVAFGRAWRARAAEMSMSTKVDLLTGLIGKERSGGAVYARAQNLVPLLRRAYDAALGDFDALVMPTLPMAPRLLPTTRLDADDFTAQALDMSANNCATNLTGHPAVSVPCPSLDGLPVGMMLVGRRHEDATVLRIADAYQRALYRQPRPTALAGRSVR